jgi:D-3-phosphoglycerate dehydrogenase / 2-oxoglutarate reductase
LINILCPEPESFSKKGLAYLKKNTNLVAKTMSQEKFDKEAPSYNAVLVRFNTKVTSTLMGKNSKIKAILSPTTGLDHIDLKAAQKMNIKIFHLKGESEFLKKISGTAELTIGLMLSSIRKIPSCFEAVKNNEWGTERFRGNEVSEKTIGIIGYGRLGSKVSKVAMSLNMNVIFYDPYISDSPIWAVKKETLKEVLSKSDILSIHVPLDKTTNQMIGFNEVKLMKKGMVLINTSRGAVISSDALIFGLQSGKIAAAGLDVLENESLVSISGNKLIEYAKEYDNLLITSHIGGATYESVEKTDVFISKKYLNYLGVI